MSSNKQDLLDGALGAGAEQAAWRTFWLTHIRIGFAIFLAETVVVAGYLALTPRAAGICGLAAMASLTLVALADRDVASSPGRAFLLFAALAGASVLTVAAAINRTHIEEHEAQLLEALADMAAVDELTGCAVRRVLRQRMEEEIARSVRSRSPPVS